MTSSVRAILVSLCAVALLIAAPSAWADYSITQESQSGSVGASSLGQSFTTTDEGRVTQIDVRVDNNNFASTVTLRIYAGSTSPNSSAEALCEQTFTGLPTGSSDQWFSLPVSNPGCRIVLSAATQYTFEVSGAPSVDLNADWSDPYPGGVQFQAGVAFSGRDLAFRVFFQSPVPVELQSFSVE